MDQFKVINRLSEADNSLTQTIVAAALGAKPSDFIVKLKETIVLLEDLHMDALNVFLSDVNLTFVSEVPEGWDTVLGYLAKHNPEAAELVRPYAAEGTQRDGFWLCHRCREQGIVPKSVDAPSILQMEGIKHVNAYPDSLLKRRFNF